MLKGHSRLNTEEALKPNRSDLWKVIALLTGHWTVARMGFYVPDLLCRKWGEAKETAQHVIFNCPALSRKTVVSLGTLWSGGQIGEQDQRNPKYFTIIEKPDIGLKRNVNKSAQ